MEIIDVNLELTPRVQKGLMLKNEERFKKRDIWLEEMTVLDNETIKLPLVIRNAIAVSKVLNHMPVKIEDHELIVGIAVQNSVGNLSPFPEYATREEKERAALNYTSPLAVFGHFCPSYTKLLALGVGGLAGQAKEKLDEIIDNRGDAEKKAWYEAVIIALDALKSFILRYANLANSLMETAVDSKRKEELLVIHQIAQRLSCKPPDSFREAIQLLWFSHIAFESTLNFLSLGRFDQNLWPFLKNDVDKNIITLEKAQELIDCLWLKFNDRLSTYENASQIDYFPPTMSVDEMVGTIAGNWSLWLGGNTSQDRMVPLQGSEFNTWLQTMPLSGLTPEGTDATNSLTYLCINATRRLKLPQPSIYVRLHDGSPDELYKRAVDCIQNSIGPAIFNDEVIIPALVKQGFPIEHARDYTTDGCWETFIQGKSQFKYGVISAPEALMRALFPGRWDNEAFAIKYIAELDPFRNSDIPDPYKFSAYDELWDSFKDQLERYIKGVIETVDKMWGDGRLYDIAPLPLISACMEGPLESGTDLTKHGSQYLIYTPFLGGLSHTADSLAAIKKLCFEEKKIDFKEVLDSVRDNWEGKESLRQMVMSRAPSYGNDDDYVDDIARSIVEFYVEATKKYGADSKNKIIFNPSIGTFEHYVAMGLILPAMPDGRLAHEPIASNASPTNGRAKNGQTAAINSYLKLPLGDLPTGAPLDLGMDARMNHLLEPLIRSFIEKKGNLLSISINDVEKLKAAMKEPEKYRDLKVRIGGWEAFFVDLPPAYQEWQIKKYEQYGG